MQTLPAAASIYTEEYAGAYDALYVAPWERKHRWNVATITRILAGLPAENCRWLDLCCGQAWHFSRFPDSIVKIGLDMSLAQLRLARRRGSDATFLRSDVLKPGIRGNQFDLVTSFWGAYCYLDDIERIGSLVDNAIAMTRPGGTVYLEILLPEMLAGFNDSAFAAQSGFRVSARTDDFGQWSYRDCGGVHLMTSPPLAFFTTRLAPHFRTLDVRYDGGFMHHLVACQKA